MQTLTTRQARRLALVRAGLLKPEWTGMPRRAKGAGVRARRAALSVVERFGYLQLDTVCVAGARSHVIVLLSRIEGMDPSIGEELLQPGRPVFEYWGHEASWLPLTMYPLFEFRRRAFFSEHPWWGEVVRENPGVTKRLRARIRDEGPLRTLDMEGRGSRGWWDLKVAKRVASALWSSGELAIRERRNFQRSYDLAERVIPDELRERPVARDEAIEALALKALDGHGWATPATIRATWRLQARDGEVAQALERLCERGEVVACALGTRSGWIRPGDLELASRCDAVRPRKECGVLLSPFDPVLWDRARVRQLFDFEQLLEIFKPAPEREYGYYCMPVLAGETLVGRVDLKADRKAGRLRVVARHREESVARVIADEATRVALERYAAALSLELDDGGPKRSR